MITVRMPGLLQCPGCIKASLDGAGVGRKARERLDVRLDRNMHAQVAAPMKLAVNLEILGHPVGVGLKDQQVRGALEHRVEQLFGDPIAKLLGQKRLGRARKKNAEFPPGLPCPPPLSVDMQPVRIGAVLSDFEKRAPRTTLGCIGVVLHVAAHPAQSVPEGAAAVRPAPNGTSPSSGIPWFALRCCGSR